MNGKKTIKKIPVDVLRNAHKLLDEVMEMLEPYLVVLTRADRQVLVKMRAETFKFVELSYGLAVEYPELFPSFKETAIFKEEFITARELWSFDNKLNRLKDTIIDTEMAAGSNVLETALAFYHTVKIAARRDIPGARTIYEELKPGFPSRRRRQQQAKGSRSG